MEHYWTLKYAGRTLEKSIPQNASSSFSVAVKTEVSIELDTSFTETL